MTSNFVDLVDLALRNPGDSFWFPELTTELVRTGWQALYRKAGLSPDSYGTARAIACDASAARRIISHLPIFQRDESLGRVLQVETLDAEFAHRYEQAGVKFYTTEEINAANLLCSVKDAINLLERVPSLLSTVASLVRSIHLIKTEDDDYDVSFSEPYIPFSIFVSVPQERSLINIIRIAEAIVHEAMHLQLTLIEQIVPLVVTSKQKFFSPWRRENRSSEGILQALYVFRVIDHFLEELLALPCGLKEGTRHICERRSEIADEIEQSQQFQNCPDLSPTGAVFVKHLIFKQ